MSDDTKAAPTEGAATDTSAQPAPAGVTATPPTRDGASQPQPSPAPEPIRKPIEQWQVEKGVLGWLFAFACTHNRWPKGRELTEAEFEAAIKAAFDVAFR